MNAPSGKPASLPVLRAEFVDTDPQWVVFCGQLDRFAPFFSKGSVVAVDGSGAVRGGRDIGGGGCGG